MSFLVMEPGSWPEVMPATMYRGRPVLEQRPDESEDLTSSYQRLLSTLDNGSAIPRVTDVAGMALPVIGHRWIGMGRAERSAFRSLVYALRGQQKPLWVPTHADDLTLVATVSQLSTALDVRNIGYARFANGRPGRRDIRIELYDGTVYHRRILTSTELDADTERWPSMPPWAGWSSLVTWRAFVSWRSVAPPPTWSRSSTSLIARA
ncbi:hypothetical protein P4054_29170 [Pseudomonas aeruginosa]|nr:hypothetical protein [Pseudomonas aeruginosa]